MIESKGRAGVLSSIAPRLTIGEHDDGRIAIAFDVVVATTSSSASEPLIVRQELLVEKREAAFIHRMLGQILAAEGRPCP